MIKNVMNNKGIEYDVVVADEDMEFAKANKISSVPVLLVSSGDEVISRFNNASAILGYINK